LRNVKRSVVCFHFYKSCLFLFCLAAAAKLNACLDSISFYATNRTWNHQQETNLPTHYAVKQHIVLSGNTVCCQTTRQQAVLSGNTLCCQATRCAVRQHAMLSGNTLRQHSVLSGPVCHFLRPSMTSKNLILIFDSGCSDVRNETAFCKLH